jgi:hypothetical protein
MLYFVELEVVWAVFGIVPSALSARHQIPTPDVPWIEKPTTTQFEGQLALRRVSPPPPPP